MLTRSLILIAALLLTAHPGAAQQKTMLSLSKVKFGKTRDYVAAFNTAVVPTLDQLLADGVIDAYGLDVEVLHVAGQPNVAQWFTASSYEKLQKADDAVFAAASAHPAEMNILLENLDIDSHRDLLLESVAGTTGKIPAAAKPFTSVSYFSVRPGREADWNQWGKKYMQPMYDQLVADGAIYGYQVLTQGMHLQDPGGTWVVVTLPGMAALDKLDAAYESRMKTLTPSERSIMQNTVRELTNESAHRDSLMRAAAFRTK